MQNLPLGIELFMIGFPTVFAVLVLIVFSGFMLQNYAIPALEKWIPEENLISVQSNQDPGADTVPPDVVAAITSAVQVSTKGKYSVMEIKKHN